MLFLSVSCFVSLGVLLVSAGLCVLMFFLVVCSLCWVFGVFRGCCSVLLFVVCLLCVRRFCVLVFVCVCCCCCRAVFVWFGVCVCCLVFVVV